MAHERQSNNQPTMNCRHPIASEQHIDWNVYRYTIPTI